MQTASAIFCRGLQEDAESIDCSEPIDKFEDLELSLEFRRLGLDIFPGESGSEPPSKRRKLSEEPELVGEIVANLYSLLGSQKVTNLAELHQVAE